MASATATKTKINTALNNAVDRILKLFDKLIENHKVIAVELSKFYIQYKDEGITELLNKSKVGIPRRMIDEFIEIGSGRHDLRVMDYYMEMYYKVLLKLNKSDQTKLIDEGFTWFDGDKKVQLKIKDLSLPKHQYIFQPTTDGKLKLATPTAIKNAISGRPSRSSRSTNDDSMDTEPRQSVRRLNSDAPLSEVKEFLEIVRGNHDLKAFISMLRELVKESSALN